MGNRCVITTKENFENNGVGIYLHWNGGRDSVEAFLKYCELKGYRGLGDSYGFSRLCQVIGNFFGGSCSIGIDTVNHLSCEEDNGVYFVDGWEIVGRKYFDNCKEQNNYNLKEMLVNIDKFMPELEQLGEEFLLAEEVPTEDLKIGDVVFIKDWNGKILKQKIVGFGKEEHENGVRINGKPLVNLYADNNGNYEWNPNNYIREKTVKIVKKETE